MFQCFFFFLKAYVVCAFGRAITVTLSFLSFALLQALAGVTLSMLLRHIRRYFVVGTYCKDIKSCNRIRDFIALLAKARYCTLQLASPWSRSSNRLHVTILSYIYIYNLYLFASRLQPLDLPFTRVCYLLW